MQSVVRPSLVMVDFKSRISFRREAGSNSAFILSTTHPWNVPAIATASKKSTRCICGDPPDWEHFRALAGKVEV